MQYTLLFTFIWLNRYGCFELVFILCFCLQLGVNAYYILSHLSDYSLVDNLGILLIFVALMIKRATEVSKLGYCYFA